MLDICLPCTINGSEFARWLEIGTNHCITSPLIKRSPGFTPLTNGVNHCILIKRVHFHFTHLFAPCTATFVIQSKVVKIMVYVYFCHLRNFFLKVAM